MTSTTRIRSRSRTLALVVLGSLALVPAAAASAAPPLGPGDEGPRVAALQRAFGVEVTGSYSEALRTAVTRLQRANGLEADGSVGPTTWGLLERIRARVRRRVKAQAAPSPATKPHAREAKRPVKPARRDPAHAPRREPALPARPRSGALGGGWGSALVTSLRLSSSRAIGGQVLRKTKRVPVRSKRAPVPMTRKVVTRAVRGFGVDGPVLRMGKGSHVRVKPRPRAARPQLPLRVRQVIAAGNRIATRPYRYGGGHGNFNDSGYDCSGSVSYALHGAGLLDVALASSGFMSWGQPGPGRWISIYANGGHAFMVVAGRRFDTSGGGQTGSRWQTAMRDTSGYVVRHPAGL
jgi:cell wall-associated NlpC family hydrolase